MLADSGNYLPYSALPKHAGTFDLIIARHVLEHSYDPIESLTSLRSLLSPGGTLSVEVPCLQAGARHLFGKHWDGFYLPYHPIHFTPRSLALAFRAAGFTVVEHGKAEMPKMGRSLQNLLGCEYHFGLFALGVALQPVQLGMSLLTGHPTCLRLWGQT